MAKRGLVADPEELDRITAAFREAWGAVQPGLFGAMRERAHREWLAMIILGLRASGHTENLSALASEQFIATAPAVATVGLKPYSTIAEAL